MRGKRSRRLMAEFTTIRVLIDVLTYPARDLPEAQRREWADKKVASFFETSLVPCLLPEEAWASSPGQVWADWWGFLIFLPCRVSAWPGDVTSRDKRLGGLQEMSPEQRQAFLLEIALGLGTVVLDYCRPDALQIGPIWSRLGNAEAVLRGCLEGVERSANPAVVCDFVPTDMPEPGALLNNLSQFGMPSVERAILAKLLELALVPLVHEVYLAVDVEVPPLYEALAMSGYATLRHEVI